MDPALPTLSKSVKAKSHGLLEVTFPTRHEAEGQHVPQSIPAAEVAATYRHALIARDAPAVLTVP